MTFNQLNSALDRAGGSAAPWPLLATLAAGQVNAKLSRDQKSGVNVIYFERGLFLYFYEFAITLGWCLPPIGLQQLVDDTKLSSIPGSYTMPPEASSASTSLLYRYVVQGTPWAGDGRPYNPSSHNIMLTMFLLSAMERFVIGPRGFSFPARASGSSLQRRQLGLGAGARSRPRRAEPCCSQRRRGQPGGLVLGR
jgi:hypothetical protein